MSAPPDAGTRASGGAADAASSLVELPAPSEPIVSRPLRLGLLVDSLVLPAWVERVVDELTAGGVAEIALVVLNDGPADGGSSSAAAAPARPASGGALGRARRWWENREMLPYALYERVDRRRYSSGDASPHRPVDMSERLAGAPTLRVHPRMTKFSDFIEAADVERIRAHDLDVALRLGFRILKGDVLRAPRHGVWSFHHGDNAVNRGGPPGFWEVFLGEPTTGATLQRLTEELDGGQVIARVHASTNPISATANRDNLYWQAGALLVSQLRLLRDTRDVGGTGDGVGEGGAATTRTEQTWDAYCRPLYVAPRPAEVLRLSARLGGRLVKRKVSSWFRDEQWTLFYRLAPARGARVDVPDGVMFRYRELRPPRDRFWADPFPVEHDGRHWLFYEEFVSDAPYAHINVVEIDESGRPLEHAAALKRDYHLSYPAVFRWRDEWWMTPETAQIGKVQLFRASRFPHEWVHEADLLDGVVATDPTLAEVDGRWWLFVGVRVAGATEATALHLYHAPTPLGPWRPHRRNPVKVDVVGARPAGRLFRLDGRLYRPAQVGAPAYGAAVAVQRIEALSPDDFREREVARIEPGWKPGLVGTHTLNAAGRLSATDARRVRPALFGRPR